MHVEKWKRKRKWPASSPATTPRAPPAPRVTSREGPRVTCTRPCFTTSSSEGGVCISQRSSGTCSRSPDAEELALQPWLPGPSPHTSPRPNQQSPTPAHTLRLYFLASPSKVGTLITDHFLLVSSGTHFFFSVFIFLFSYYRYKAFAQTHRIEPSVVRPCKFGKVQEDIYTKPRHKMLIRDLFL